jgi:hypothetical protein
VCPQPRSTTFYHFQRVKNVRCEPVSRSRGIIGGPDPPAATITVGPAVLLQVDALNASQGPAEFFDIYFGSVCRVNGGNC